jgi:hypothetical protein
VISADQDPESLAKAWFYVPRMLASKAAVFLEGPADQGEPTLRRLSIDELEKLSIVHVPRRKAA